MKRRTEIEVEREVEGYKTTEVLTAVCSVWDDGVWIKMYFGDEAYFMRQESLKRLLKLGKKKKGKKNKK